MSKELVTQKSSAIELALINGDLSKLTAEERLNYYQQTCDSLGLNPLTKPFDYITLNGKLTLYARKDATEQLRRIYGVSIVDMQEKALEGVYVVTVKAQDREGRVDMAKGAVTILNLKGDALANAMMKAETKAKRRATLSICGLGMLDETEVETIKDAHVAPIAAVPELKTADQLQAEATKKAFKDDDISFAPQTKSGVYVYDLREYLEGLETAKYNQVLRYLDKVGAFEDPKGIYTANEYFEKLSAYIVNKEAA